MPTPVITSNNNALLSQSNPFIMKGRVAIIHPDLGIGGAERLIVDFALALQESNYHVKIFTSHYDRNRCFRETTDGSLQVETVFSWLPRSTYGYFHALWAYLKVFLIGLYLCIFHRNDYDIFLADQVPSCLPILKLLCRKNGAKMAFYCHYPDMLLSKHDSDLKIIYRYFIDKFEGWSISLADLIMVNSMFTASVVRKTFDRLKSRELEVLYPCVNLPQVDAYDESKPEDCSEEINTLRKRLDKNHFTFLSLNRFEPKKNIVLALEALRDLLRSLALNEKQNLVPHLIIAGGYDPRVDYCVNYLERLKNIVRIFELESHVTFITSPSDHEKLIILRLCNAVIYTPTDEHFGIVPLEAMAMGRPVIACNSGGPVETVKHEETGYLCAPNPESFSKYMYSLMTATPEDLRKMGKHGIKHVQNKFNFGEFQQKIKLKFHSLLQRN